MKSNSARTLHLIPLLLAVAPVAAQGNPRLVGFARIDGDRYGWTRIHSVAIRESVGLFVADRALPHVWRFGLDGRSQGVTGAAGEGPGEFRGIRSIWLPQDKVAVLDSNMPRVSFFDYDLRHAYAAKLPIAVHAGGGFGASVGTSALVLAVPGPGLFLAYAGFRADGPRPDWAPRGPADGVFALVDSLGSIQRTVAYVGRPRRCILQARRQNVRATVTVPYCREYADAVSPDGGVLVLATDSLVETGRPVMALTAIRVTGDTVYSRSWDYAPRTVPPELREREAARLQRQVAFFRNRVGEFEDREVPRTFPAFSDVSVGDDGQVWLTSWSTGGPLILTRFSARGVPIDTFSVTAGSRVVASLRDTVWLEVLDADDVPSLQGFRIVRGEPPP